MTISIAHQISARWRIVLAAVVSTLSLALAAAGGAAAAPPTATGHGVFASSLVAGPDGALWYGGTSHLESSNVVGRVGPAGELSEFKVPVSLPTELGTLPGIAVGSDGNLWLTTTSDKLLKATPSGAISEVKVPAKELGAIVSAPDGSLRFTSKQNLIGRVTTGGEASTTPLPASSEPTGLAIGAEGLLWITERGGNAIARLNGDNSVSRFALPNAGSKPNAIVLGPDGNLWFTEEGAPRIGRITPNGQITEFTVPGTSGTRLISTGPSNDLWYTQDNTINSISTGGDTGTPGCVDAECETPLSAIARGPAGELAYATNIRPTKEGGGIQSTLAFFGNSTIGTFTPPPLATEMPGRIHLGPKRVVVVPLACDGGAAGTYCNGRVQLRNGGKPFGGAPYSLERNTVGKLAVRLHGRPAKALVRNGRVSLRVVAFNDAGEGSTRAVTVRTRPRR